MTTIGIPKESAAGETRVAAVPEVAAKYRELGAEVVLESGAGELSFFPDDRFENVAIVGSAEELWATADVVLTVQGPSLEFLQHAELKPNLTLVGLLAPYGDLARVAMLRDRGVTAFAMELLPRLTRAQSMDVLSSQATVSGQKAALMAACAMGRLFPMLTTAAGTQRPAKVVVLGAGVAGLQAIATAKRLGAVVEAYDVRRTSRQEIESVGGRFIDVGIDATGDGGYARELTPDERARQDEELARHMIDADAVITTAAVPGRRAPMLVPASLVARMKRGSVIVDLGAESGGNCELSRPGETVRRDGVLIHAPLNVPALLPAQASDMLARNLYNFLSPWIVDGVFAPDWDDEVIAGTLLVRDGEIVHEPTRDAVSAWEAARVEAASS